MRLKSLSENKNKSLTFNYEDKKSLMNINRSFDAVMPPNDLTDIYKKNIVFSKLINNE